MFWQLANRLSFSYCVEYVIAGYWREIKEAQASLARGTASLRLFELCGDSAEFSTYINLNRVPRRGDVTNTCMAPLEVEGPLDTRELTSRVMDAKGLNRDDWILAQAILLRIVQTLRMNALRGGGARRSERRKGVCLAY